jgi:site-specific DNA-methyltransferase (adenine-specific)
MTIPSALTTSKRQDWETPGGVFDAMKGRYPYDIDLCASIRNKKCATYIGLDQPVFGTGVGASANSLSQRWAGRGFRFGWLNPPFGDKKYPVRDWAMKAYLASTEGLTVTMLVPLNKLDQPWFHLYAVGKAEVLVVEGRIQFLDPDTGKKSRHGNSQGSVLITWGPGVEPKLGSIKFADHGGKSGRVQAGRKKRNKEPVPVLSPKA